MPPLDKELEEHNPEPMRVLAYGVAKTKKTWWAGKAAESGFNVILIDSDNGAHILHNIAPEARERITHIKTVGHTDDSSIPAAFLTQLLTGKPFLWDEGTRRVAPTVEMHNEAHSHYFIDISKLTMNEVLVIDSWTKVAGSLIYRWFVENKIEFTSILRAIESNQRTHRGMFGWTRQMATWMTNQLLTLPCHVIVIAHQTVYEKRKVDEQGREVVEWARTQPISTSGPHAMQMGVDFSEILYFSRAMQFFKIDTAGETLREGGCRFTPPKSYSWEELQFVDICKIANSPLPNTIPPEYQTAFRWFAAGEDMPDDLLGNLPRTSGILPASQPITSPKQLFSNLLGGNSSE